VYIPEKKLKTTIKVYGIAYVGTVLCNFTDLKKQHCSLKKVEKVKRHNRSSLYISMGILFLHYTLY